MEYNKKHFYFIWELIFILNLNSGVILDIMFWHLAIKYLYALKQKFQYSYMIVHLFKNHENFKCGFWERR